MPERLIDSNDNEIQQEDDEVAVSIPTISPDFILKESLHLTKRTDQLVSVSYNTRKKMFLLLDTSGMTTWEWKNLTNKVNRVLEYKIKDSKELLDIVYCELHNCYFVLRPDSSISIFDRDFDQVFRMHKTNRAILSMIYNPVNDELLTSAIDGLKVWKLKKCERENWRSTKPLASYALVLIKEIPLRQGQDWIKKMQLDIPNCQLYCCSTTDMYIYDFNGDLIKHYADMHQMEITCCAYSPSAKVIITGSLDTSIKIWSLTGGLLENLKAHSLPVTTVLINPHNSNLFISSSLDGTIKMWSLDIMQLVYQLTLFKSEIIWMGLVPVKGESLLYAASSYDITVWSITNFIEFWAIARDRIKRIDFNYSKGKSTRLIICTEQNTILLFNRDKAYQMSIVLPIPKLDNNTKIKSVVYCRSYDLLFIMIDNNELWIYCTKTNPATHINSFNIFDIQDSLEDYEEEINSGHQALRMNVQKKVNNLIVQDLMRNHRAVEYGLNYLNRNDKSLVRCVSILDSMVQFWNEEGLCCPLVQSFLLLGLENGKILFCDPLNQNRKYFTLACSKDPIVDIQHDQINNHLVVRIETSSLFHIEYFSLPNFDLVAEIYCLKTMTSFSRLDNKVLIGFENGSLDMNEIKHVETKDISNRFPTETEVNDILTRKYKEEHKQRIEIIDSCKRFNIFASCSLDGLIKLWDLEKNLVAEIKLDDTLSYCRFCNTNGDLVCGWRNHLFKIVLSRTLPQFSIKEGDNFYEENDDAFLDDSIIIEDPSLKKSNEDDKTVIMDMEKYLYPFDINLEKNGLVKVKPKKKDPKEAKILRDLHRLSKQHKDKQVASQISFLSSIPGSLYSTPRENPLNDLTKIDLTLNSKISKEDIKAYLSDWISQTLIENNNIRQDIGAKKGFGKNFKFPFFGKSPNVTPCVTPDPSEQVEAAQTEVTPKPKESAVNKQFSREIANENYRYKNERRPASKKNRSANEVKQNLKVASSSSLTNVATKPPIPPQIGTPLAFQQQLPEDIYEPFKNQFRTVQATQEKTKKSSKRTSASSTTRDRVKKPIAYDSNNLTQSFVKSEVSIVSRRKRSILDNQIESIKETRTSLQSDLSLGNDKKRVNSIDSRYVSSKADSYKESVVKSASNSKERLKSAVNRRLNLGSLIPRAGRRTNQSNRNELKSARSREQEEIESKGENTNDEDFSEETNIKEGHEKIEEEKENETQEDTNANKLQSNNLKVLWSKNLNVLDGYDNMSETTRAKCLFEYLYGLKGLPLRIRSSTFRETKATENDYFIPDNSVKDTITTTEENLYEKKSLIRNYTFENPHLFDWLRDYENRSKANYERLNRVRENNLKLQEEYNRAKSAVVERKRWIISAISQEKYERRLPLMSASSANSEKHRFNRPSTTIGSFNNRKLTKLTRETKSASQNEAIKHELNKRPKSVSFAFNKVMNNSTVQKEDQTYVDIPYLVSQIEMEEILKEAEQKFMEKKSSFSSYRRSKSNSDSHVRINNEMVTRIETDEDSDYNELSEFFTSRKSRSAKTTQSDFTIQTVTTTSEDALIRTEHRLPSRSFGRRKSSTNKTISWDKLPEYLDSNEETSDQEASKATLKLPLKRIRTPCSIPSKAQRYILVEMPQINLEYSLPNSREKYLLPIRFPKLYGKIINSLTKLDQKILLSSKRINSATVDVA